MKKLAILIILLSTVLISCNEGKGTKAEVENEPEVYYVEEADVEIDEAIQKANKTFNEFAEFLKNNPDKNFYYSIKQSFPTSDGGSEHVWIGQITYDENNYKGILGNKPVYTNEVKIGDTVTINKNEISDWMIVDDNTGITKGAYTIKVIRSRMTPQEKKEFDEENGLKFE